MNTVWIGLNLIPFISLFIVKNIVPIAYKKRDYALCFLYYYMNVNSLCFIFSHYNRIINTNTIEFFPLIKYTLCFEGIFYFWHRFSHLPGVYRLLHAHHHVNYQVEPMDFIDVDYVDSVGFHVCMHLPLVLIPLHSLEYLGWYFVMTTSGFLLHSDLLIEHHALHHKYFHCHYCFIFPIFDYVFGTHRIQKSIHNV